MRKRHFLTFQQRLEVLRDLQTSSVTSVAKKFKVHVATIRRIQQNAPNIALQFKTKCSSSKLVRTTVYERLEEELISWYKCKVKLGSTVPDSLFLKQATKIKKALSLKGKVKPNKRWLKSFIHRHNIRSFKQESVNNHTIFVGVQSIIKEEVNVDEVKTKHIDSSDENKKNMNCSEERNKDIDSSDENNENMNCSEARNEDFDSSNEENKDMHSSEARNEDLDSSSKTEYVYYSEARNGEFNSSNQKEYVYYSEARNGNIYSNEEKVELVDFSKVRICDLYSNGEKVENMDFYEASNGDLDSSSETEYIYYSEAKNEEFNSSNQKEYMYYSEVRIEDLYSNGEKVENMDFSEAKNGDLYSNDEKVKNKDFSEAKKENIKFEINMADETHKNYGVFYNEDEKLDLEDIFQRLEYYIPRVELPTQLHVKALKWKFLGNLN